MRNQEIQTALAEGKTYLGIELGSTRIKGVLIGPDWAPIASGEFSWENRYENGVWTYHLEDVWQGLQTCFAQLAQDVVRRYGQPLTRVGAMGFSGMMHGYLPFDAQGQLLAPFRTWRNTMTGPAAAELTKLLRQNIPQRWSAAHLYQAILNGEEHVNRIDFLTTLAGYVHWKLTGRKVLGVGEASGMFPIDSTTKTFDAQALEAFQAAAQAHGWAGDVHSIFPQVCCAGEDAGELTPQGAQLLDPTGTLQPGCPVAPPEGDAGTGMVATNSVAVSTGNVSAGTSIFSMVVLDHPLSQVYEEIDLVTTPAGAPVAMVHCNNCTNEINAWAQVFREFLEALGQTPDMNQIYTAMFQGAAQGERDCGGLVLYNYLSGEPVTGFAQGRPLLCRRPQDRLNFANLMRAQLSSAVATLKIGMDILAREQVQIHRLFGHGGYFKTPVVGQSLMAAALGVPVSVMETAGEGGAWGMALLAAYRVDRQPGETLEAYLADRVFAGQTGVDLAPVPEDQEGFQTFMGRYRAGLAVERAAVDCLTD